MTGFCKIWIDGTESVKKDSLEKYIKGKPHKTKSDLKLKGLLGLSSYQEKILATTPISRSVTKMVEKDKKVNMVFFIDLNLSVLLKSCCK